MTSLIVALNLASLIRSTRGSITADLHIRTEDVAFPDSNWNDFVVVVLGWWIEALEALGAEGAATELRFMDGPYLMRVTKRDSGIGHIEFVMAGIERTVLCRAEVDLVHFLFTVKQVGSDLVEACRGRQWSSPDIDTLKARCS